MQGRCFLTAAGQFLPGAPVGNEEMEARLGQIGSKPSALRERVLRQNGITQRYYAIDANQQTVTSNVQMAARAVRKALAESALDLKDIELLVAATSQSDLPLPGFASMVQGELKMPPCEVATVHGICASSVVALRYAALAVGAGEAKAAVCVASELVSRLLKASRFQGQGYGDSKRLPFETEFLRWMLSDGAGALLLQERPAERGLSLEIEQIVIKSYAGDFAPCMFVGNRDEVYAEPSTGWLDYPDYATAAAAGAINLHQSVDMLKDVVRLGVNGVFEMVEEGRIDPKGIDWWVTHYSSHLFHDQAYELFVRGGITIPRDRIFTNLYTSGNMGAASFPTMLGDLFRSGKLQPGERILCIVPESGRFMFGYVVLRVVGPEGQGAASGTSSASGGASLSALTEMSIAPDIKTGGTAIEETLVRQLAQVWTEFETRLHHVPIVAKMESGRMTVQDYRDLLFNLRQQVIDGSRWISRVASNITREHFPLRSAFIGHSSDEHRDFEMIERDYASVGGDIEAIRAGVKNVGSTALSEYILSRASRENPFDLIGAMFIIEGLGRRVAGGWGELIRAQLGLEKRQVSFLTYHSASDDIHFERLDAAVQSGILTEPLVADVVKAARVTARLYLLQLEEIGNF
jgi:3-oxoacyl-[acyl-carrier-protein] synthase-3